VTTERLEYPVLTIAWNGFLAAGESERTLKVCSDSGFESGFYDSLRIIDSRGASYTVQAARRERRVEGGLGGLLQRSRLWQVDLQLAPGVTMGLPDIKAQVVAAIHQRASQWGEDGAHEDVARAAQAAASLQELIGLFADEA